MSLIESIVLGIIQGLTEFLPVSSSGHLELGKEVLGVKFEENAVLYSAVVHAATALSTIVVYYKDILNLISELFKFQWNDATKFVVYILISMIPAGLVYVFFKEQLDVLFSGQIMLVGFMLLITAGLLMASSRIQSQPGELNPIKAFIVGLAQAFALLPGVSRSGSTISTALMLGISRETAARFSFLMVIPVILGGTMLELKDYFDAESTTAVVEVGTDVLVAGFLAAFISGLIACTWMIRIVKNAKLDYFAIYCVIVGIIAILAGAGIFG
ncbi:MAG: undecaprenyl-diphosphate phosphatase [Bacteroidota bacterium]